MPTTCGDTTTATPTTSWRTAKGAPSARSTAPSGDRAPTVPTRHSATSRAGFSTSSATLSRGPAPAHVVDLGCGVGASLCYLAARLPIRGHRHHAEPGPGATRRRRIREAGLSDRLTCLEGDYCALPESIPPADLAYAVESFVHGPNPTRFFAQCARLVRPHGLLVICDDFRRPVTEPAATRAVERFRRGWHLNTLIHPEDLRAVATAAGFEHVSTDDLTPHLGSVAPATDWWRRSSRCSAGYRSTAPASATSEAAVRCTRVWHGAGSDTISHCSAVDLMARVMIMR